MKRMLTFFFFLFTCILNRVDAQHSSQGKLFIIGGGDRPPDMINRMIRESGLDRGGYAVILPMSSFEQDSAIFFAQEQFTSRDINAVYGMQMDSATGITTSRLDSIRHARLIYLTGGDQARFMDIVKGTPVIKAIQDAYNDGAMVAGTSAGASLMSSIMVTGNQLKYHDYDATFSSIESDNIETIQGLGLMKNVIIDQHFLIRSRHNRLITAILQYPDLKGIGIDESTAILVTGHQAEVIGLSQVLVYSNPHKSVKMLNGKFGAKGLSLSIYLPGEKFKI
jgi:cyanophycinase